MWNIKFDLLAFMCLKTRLGFLFHNRINSATKLGLQELCCESFLRIPPGVPRELLQKHIGNYSWSNLEILPGVHQEFLQEFTGFFFGVPRGIFKKCLWKSLVTQEFLREFLGSPSWREFPRNFSRSSRGILPEVIRDFLPVIFPAVSRELL